MSYVSKKIKEAVDKELKIIRDDLLQLCDLPNVNMKTEIKAYFQQI